MHGRKLPPAARTHAIGALLVVGLAAVTWLLVFSSDLTHPGTRVSVLLGGVLVTAVLLGRDLRDVWVAAYTLAFFCSFGLFAALGA
ncbi:MAG TPA: hypothetical protein VFR97_15315 [Capillimicrobium sp.]|nr:hypothetical protein [Capillimicrobium sp.]